MNREIQFMNYVALCINKMLVNVNIDKGCLMILVDFKENKKDVKITYDTFKGGYENEKSC